MKRLPQWPLMLSAAASAVLLMSSSLAYAAKDDSFVKKAAEGNQFEIQAGQMAEQKASNPDVRNLGSKIASDHQQANSQLQQLASSENVTLSDKPANGSELKKLSGLQGQDFDKEFVKVMIRDHKRDIRLYQKEAQKGKDAQAKNFASQTIPALQSHLQMAQEAQSNLASGSSGTGGQGTRQ